eukprot:comp17745_c0_seq1/m.17730 comp17745_c0_seq1/g.17730  ORF comp17745_c0_seq1/g.17730 comp17745_c0_seq1/m.17730 type:complete len:1028 (-) comp17745_c0_seq1:445-3528(-)
MSLCRVATTPRTLLGAVGGWRTATRAMYSTAATGRVTLGDVSKELTEPTNAALVPVLYALESVPKDSLPPPGALPLTQEVLGHLRWMLQKDQLGQDVFLIGPPGPRRRSLAMAFCELTQREVEYVSLSRDTTESDLKQRREIRQATAYYVNQAAVKAAIGGRILVLEGIEKAERNVLPVLNNLLENREMRLESGEFLVAPQRYDALLKEHSKEELDKAKLLRVSENFRVIALGLPVPAYSGNPLDPPLRSRFQARDVAHMSYATQELVLSKLGAVQARSLQGLAGFASALNLAAEELKVPKFPVDLLARTARLLQSFPQLPPGVALQAVYPYRTLLPADRQKMIDELLGRFKLAVSPDTTQTHYTMGSVTPKTPTTAVVKFKVGKGEVGVDVPWGGHKHPGIEEHPFVPTPYHENLLAALTQSHVVGDICLLGGRGVGKSAVVAEFARRLGYHVEPMFMYQDMTSRDLLQQRATLSNGDTIWKPSPLVSAARAGHLLLLDGVHHVNAGTLTVLQRLIHDRELTLPDGTRLLHGARFEELKKKHGYTTEQLEEMSIHAIHPSFRIVALAEPPRPGATGGWLGDEAMTMFQYHNMRSLNATEEAAVLKSLVPEISANQLSSLVDFAHKLRSATDHTVLSLSTSLSTRQLLRICRRVRRYQHTDLYSAVHTVCLSRFLPNIARDTLDKLLSESGIKPLDDLSTDIDLKIEQIAEAGTNYVQIGDVRAPVRMLEASERVLVPDVVYYDNHQHTVVMGDMMKDFVLGEHLLLVGNQGVGKNKIVDRFLQLLSLPREYMQLHRDTTVQALTLQPTVKNGVIVYEDSALVLAVTHGRVLVVDEADKAPTHVTGILKSLAENGTMRLSDGRVIVPSSETDIRGDGVIPIHPNFRLIVLANRPGFPFLGHDFFAALGDVFSCHSIDNADPESELSMLRSYGPQVPVGVLRKLTGVFRDLRRLVTEGSLAYPYSTRELVHIVKHLQQYPDEGLGSTIRNVFDFDAYDTDTKELLAETLSRHGIPLGATAASVSLIPE